MNKLEQDKIMGLVFELQKQAYEEEAMQELNALAGPRLILLKLGAVLAAWCVIFIPVSLLCVLVRYL